jgi:tetratricopeptide (TPR) repeat protein
LPRRPPRLWRALAVALVWTFAVAAWADDADVVAQGEALVRAGRYAEAYQLLEPLEDKLAGDVKFDYLLARAALESGRPSKASFIYERILAVEPNYIGVRLEMGRAYLLLGDYARAKLEFETVLRFENLPLDLRQQAQVYGKAADDYLAGKRTVGYGYAEYSFGYDSNPQSATKTSVIHLVNDNILVLESPQLKRSDRYSALAFGGELVHALTNRFSAFAGGDARGRAYNHLTELRGEEDRIYAANFSTLDARFGLGYSEGVHNLRVGGTGGRFWLHNDLTRDSEGWTADYRYLASKRDQITLNTSGYRFRFVPEALKVNNFDLQQWALGWLRGSADGRGAFGFTVIGGVEKATDRLDGDKPFYGARITLQSTWTPTVGAFLVGGAQRGKYSRVNVLFDLTRVETLYDATAGITWSFAKGWSLRPQVQHYKNDSGIPLFEYDRTDVSVNLRADF